MPEVSIPDQIKKLVDLQTFDVEIFNLKRELEEKPAYLKEAQEKFETKKANLKVITENLKNVQVQRNAGEVELKAKEDDIAKANSQLSLLKTNKEYQAKLSEIEHLKADKSIIEERILLSYDEYDRMSKQAEKEKGLLAEEEKKYLAEKKEIDDSIKVLQERLADLQNKRGQLTPGVDKKLLARYERILANKEGVAIVPIKRDSCGGCYMNVPAQVVNQIKMHDQLVSCEMCTRILYLEEDL